MTEVYFVVDGKVQPKQRPKVYRNKYTGQVHGVTPNATRKYEHMVRDAYIEQCGRTKFEGALQMVVNIYVRIPSGTSKKNFNAMVSGEIRPTKKNGDIDNLYKAISDSLNQIAYDDDSQIVEAVIRKFYAPFDKAEITIRNLER